MQAHDRERLSGVSGASREMLPRTKASTQIVIADVAAEYGLEVSALLGHSRTLHVSVARAAAYKALRDRCGLKICQISRAMNKHHTTVIHALRGRSSWADYKIDLSNPIHAAIAGEVSFRVRDIMRISCVSRDDAKHVVVAWSRREWVRFDPETQHYSLTVMGKLAVSKARKD